MQKLEDTKVKSKKKWKDYRALVCNSMVIACMSRENSKKITNIGQGGSPLAFNPDKEIKRISINASKLIDADYAGIDLIKNKNGKLKVIEINSIPGWKAIQKTTKRNIASILAKTFVIKINKNG